ncbi:DUF2268 domain-containing protein [Bacillaceae bacterium W0354]
MGVINTDQWLIEKPDKIFTILTKYFQHANAKDIKQHLQMFGMQIPSQTYSKTLTKQLQKIHAWEIIQKEYKTLKQKWNGPDIPIFIFPSIQNNKRLIEEFNGKSGLAFKDKLFLFISKNNTPTELRALLTHEYNHVCRLNKYPKKEKDYSLLDTIIMEGMAEYAIFERFGQKYVGHWVNLYNEEQLRSMYQRFILPKLNLSKYDVRHDTFLYGFGRFPNMLGYAVGYYLVKSYLEKNDMTTDQLFTEKSETIANINQE